jgi:S-adenosylmethionine-diacylglycerol 3-amino-3-carboxypropyl transferase
VPDLARFGVVSLSNVFDWSDDALVREWGAHLAKLARGSAILVRVLNNARDVRPLLADAFAFDDELGRAFFERDRSLFYERILVGFRR